MHRLAMSSKDIVEAFCFTDEELMSVIGKKSHANSDELYKEMIEFVRKNPLNEKKYPRGFNQYIKPILQGKL